MTDTIDDKPITAHGGALRNAGDGLSDAFKLEDQQLRIGERVTLLVQGVVAPPTFKPDKDNEEGIMRVDNIRLEHAQVVTGVEQIDKLAEQHAAAVTEMKLREKEERDGIQRITFDPADDDDQAAEDGVTPDNVRGFPESI